MCVCLCIYFFIFDHVLHLLITSCHEGKPELPRQPGSTAFYDAESPQTEQTPDSSNIEPESPQSTDTNANNFFQTLDWQGNQPLSSERVAVE